MHTGIHVCLYKIRKKMITEGKDKVNGKVKHTVAWGLYKIRNHAKIKKIQKTSKGLRKGLARAIEIQSTETWGWTAGIITKWAIMTAQSFVDMLETNCIKLEEI